MMKKKSLLMLLVAVLAVMGCQSNTYNINGTAKGFADGDTIFITTDFRNGSPIGVAVVNQETFSLTNTADSTLLCMAYSAKDPGNSVIFFLEPGTINLDFTTKGGEARVSGTTLNDEWQKLSETAASYGDRINRTIEEMTKAGSPQSNIMAEVNKLNNELTTSIVSTAERNVSNELGYFIITNFSGDETVFSGERRQQLIEKLPQKMRQRPAIKEIEAQIKAAAKTAVGQTLSDITLPTPDGQQISLLAEVAKNKITVVDFWASWCGPCRQEMPSVVALYKDCAPKGLGIVGISLDNDKAAWQKALTEMDMTWTQVSDLKGWESQAARLYMINSIPQTFVLDKQGKILAKGLRGEELGSFVKAELEKMK